ncbi:probable RNA cytosine-C(5)-methyltransferase NSUN2 [Coccomyxa sp. Obi]|nr:probable RNA cytosine-C(5)-methyltransferase NSUN2 [Coccomyxa sp. Obi]
MGKRGRGGGQRVMKRDFRQQRDNSWTEQRRRDGDQWATPLLENADFEEYYKAQGIVPEGEWDAFMETLRKPLPTTFRINGRGRFAADLRDRLQQDFFSQFNENMEVDGEPLEAPKPLSWYPDKLGWHMAFSRAQLRKLPILKQVHELIIRENDAGAITRQEAVSMIPPLLLDVQPHHRVLDTCAAPGSKTAQILEMLHQGTGTPSGVVIANDADAQRCNLLTHQTKRMCSPALMVVNHDATQLPILRDFQQKQAYKFDRILCDVPCSGDGTLRKAPDIWRRWSEKNGNGLHPLQLRIALHSAQMLKVGGRMVYSTCTFNPVEDEAVVAELLRKSKSALVLLDVSQELPALKRATGLSKWLVKSNGELFSTWEEAEAKQAHAKLFNSMFAREEAGELHLERCMRLLPHQADTGGFFVAVLQKVAELPPSAFVTAPKKEPKQAKAPAGKVAQKAADAGGWSAPAAPILAGQDRPQDGGAHAAHGIDSERREQTAMEEVTDMAYEAAGHTQNFAEEIEDQDIPAATESAGEAAAAVEGVFEVLAGGEEIEEQEKAAAKQCQGSTTQERGNDVEIDDPQAAAAAAIEAQPAQVEQDSRPAPEWGSIRGGGARGRSSGGRWRGVDPIVPFTDAEQVASIREFYGLAPGLKLEEKLISRSQSDDRKPKRLYYISEGIKHLLMLDENEQLKITSTGLKLFERQDAKDARTSCLYRIAQEGLPLILPALTRQMVFVTAQELLRLLTEGSIALPHSMRLSMETLTAPAADQNGTAEGGSSAAIGIEEAAEGVQPPAKKPKTEDKAEERKERVPWSDPETLRQLESIVGGCCVCTLRNEEATALGFSAASSGATEGALAVHAPMAVSCWRGRASVNHMVARPEAAQLAEKLRAAISKREASAAPVEQPEDMEADATADAAAAQAPTS